MEKEGVPSAEGAGELAVAVVDAAGVFEMLRPDSMRRGAEEDEPVVFIGEDLAATLALEASLCKSFWFCSRRR